MTTRNDAPQAKLRDDDTERDLMGFLLANGEKLFSVRPLLRLDDLQDIQCRYVYRAICAVADAGAVPDLITVCDRLDQHGTLEQVGGHAYVSGLTERLITQAQAETYCAKLRKLTMRRTVLQVAVDLQAKAANPACDPAELLDTAERTLFDVAGERLREPYIDGNTLAHRLIEDLERRRSLHGALSGIPSGYAPIDAITDGFQASDYIVIGARTSVGKTAFALSMAANQALKHGISVGFLSLEMTALSLGYRVVSGDSRLEHSRLRSAHFQKSEMGRVFDASGHLSASKLYVSEVPNMPFSEIRSIARRLLAVEKIQILYVDYIGLVDSEDKTLPRYEQMAATSRSLKQLARELRIPVVVLSQLRRESDGRRPALSDLRETGALEQDADLVMLLHRENPESGGDTTEVECMIAKHRNGATGPVSMVLLRPYVRFEVRERETA